MHLLQQSNAKECQSTQGNAKETQQKKGVDARYVGGRTGEDTADNNQIIHVTRRHFDVPAANVYIKEAVSNDCGIFPQRPDQMNSFLY